VGVLRGTSDPIPIVWREADRDSRSRNPGSWPVGITPGVLALTTRMKRRTRITRGALGLDRDDTRVSECQSTLLLKVARGLEGLRVEPMV